MNLPERIGEIGRKAREIIQPRGDEIVESWNKAKIEPDKIIEKNHKLSPDQFFSIQIW